MIATAAICAPSALAVGPQTAAASGAQTHGTSGAQTITPTPLAHSQPLNLPPIVSTSALVVHRGPVAFNRTGFDWSAAAIGALAALPGVSS